MPNWCSNELDVTGPHEAIIALFGEDPDEISFDRLLPVPPIDAFGEASYHWRLAHWGTKWDIAGEIGHARLTDGKLTICFSTAWSPPSPLIEALGARTPELTFTLSYAESGNDFAGQLTVQGTTSTLRVGAYTDICDYHSNYESDDDCDDGSQDDDWDGEWVVRGDLTDVCGDLPLDERHQTLTALADAIAAGTAAGTFQLDDPGDLTKAVPALNGGATAETLLLAAAISGHRGLATALVPHLDPTSATEIAARASGSIGGAGNVVRAIAAADDPTIAAIGRLFLGLGTALSGVVDPLTTLSNGPAVTPALERLLSEASTHSRVTEWAETAVGLAGEWTGTIDQLLEAAWQLVSR